MKKQLIVSGIILVAVSGCSVGGRYGMSFERERSAAIPVPSPDTPSLSSSVHDFYSCGRGQADRNLQPCGASPTSTGHAAEQ